MDDKKERTVYCGNLSEKATEEILYELFLQAGPLECVKIPKGRNYGFITFKHEVSVPYAVALLNGLVLFGREIRLELRSGSASQHNPYLETILAHRRSFSCPEKMRPLDHQHFDGHRGPDNYGWNTPFIRQRSDKTSHLKERYTNSPPLKRPFVHPGVMFQGLAPTAMYISPTFNSGAPYFPDGAMRTLHASPSDYRSSEHGRLNKMTSNNHMRERTRRYY